jgi:hypothetical protein
MPALVEGQFVNVYDDEGVSSKVALYACRNVTTGDTMDVGGDFSVVKRAGVLSDTAVGIAAMAAAGVVLTFPAGLTGDGAFVLVFGVDNFGPVEP